MLADRAPSSFLIERAWVELVERSAAKHTTWLHHLYLGTAKLEMGDAPAAEAHFNASIALQPTAHAARALALFAPDAAATSAHFKEAWSHWEQLVSGEKPPPAHYLELGRELSTEYSAWLATAERLIA